MTTATKDVLAASEQLTRVLLNLASTGLRTHCSDPRTSELWLSEIEAERAEASRLCVGCPVIIECGAAATARREKFGTWGGRDYTKISRSAKSRSAEATA